MADILIKNIELPKSCEDCPFMKKVCDIYCTDKKTGVKTPYHYINSCSLTGSRFDPFSDDSPEPCPLIPVPEHGKLIDADALKKRMTDLLRHDYVFDEVGCFGLVKEAPTVLEASE